MYQKLWQIVITLKDDTLDKKNAKNFHICPEKLRKVKLYGCTGQNLLKDMRREYASHLEDY